MKDWANFEQEVQVQARQRGPRCAVRTMLESLPDEGRRAVEGALGNRALTNSAIARALQERLGKTSPSLFSVSNHRRGQCACRLQEEA